MAKFCKFCGTPLNEGARFCPKCGKAQSEESPNPTMQQAVNPPSAGNRGQKAEPASAGSPMRQAPEGRAESRKSAPASKQDSSLGKVIMILLLVVLLGGGGFLGYQFYKQNADESTDSVRIEAEKPATESKESSEPAEKKEETKQDNSALTKVKGVLEGYNIGDEVLATSAGHTNDGSLSITKTANGQKRLVVVDNKNHRAAVLDLTSAVYNFAEQAKDHAGKVLLPLTIVNDKRDNDAVYGTWSGSNHKMGILAAFKIDGQKNVVPGMLTSGQGANPPVYQGVLYEPKNVDLANLILTEMAALHKDAQERGVGINN